MSNRYRDRPSAPPPPTFNERRRLESDNDKDKERDKDKDKGQPPQKIQKVQLPMTFINVEDASIEVIEHFDLGQKIIQDHFTGQLTHIAIDCEGMDLGKFGTLTLVQISLDEKTAFIFDILHCQALVHLLKPILESKDIVKIIHDCRSDRANLKQQFGINMNNIFDTQVAYKHILKSARREIGFNNLCQELSVGGNSLKGTIKYNSWTKKRYWMNRPLTDAMISYAAQDTLCLWGLFHKLDAKLDEKDGHIGREDFLKICQEYGQQQQQQQNKNKNKNKDSKNKDQKSDRYNGSQKKHNYNYNNKNSKQSPEDRRRFDDNNRRYPQNFNDDSRRSQTGGRRSPFENRDHRGPGPAILDKYNREPELLQNQSSGHGPSVSLIPSPPQIVRTILDPDTVKIPRRIGEGAKPIFERPELIEGIRLRMKANDVDVNPQLAAPYEQIEQPRVIAIIREPPMANFQGYSDMYSPQIPIALQQPMISPQSPQRNFNTMDMNMNMNNMDMGMGMGGHRRRSRSRSRSPPPPRNSGNFNRGRPHPGPGAGHHSQPRPQYNRDMDRRKDINTGNNNRRNRTPSPRNRVRNPSLDKNPNLVARTRVNRSRSNTPPPMPPHIRQQLIEKKERFFENRNRFNSNDRGGFSGRGGFRGQRDGHYGAGDRNRSPRPSGSSWVHDKYENATETHRRKHRKFKPKPTED